MLPVKTGFWGLSQRSLLCFVDDEHKGKSYSGYTGKCERWLVFVCVCVGVMWIWPFVKIEQHIFRTSLLKILGCIHSVSRISLSVWWHSCLPHCTTYRLDRLEASGWNKNSPICIRNSHPSPGTAQEWPRGAQIHHIDLRQRSIRRAPWQCGTGVWKILRRDRHGLPEGMIDVGHWAFRGTGVTILVFTAEVG